MRGAGLADGPSLAERAQAERARRELARRHLIDFCTYVDPPVAHLYRARHLQKIAQYVEAAEAGTLWDGVPGDGKKILIITTPPGHWKTSLISRKAPAWFVGKRWREGRGHQVVLTSYNSRLAMANNARVLELVKDSPHYKALFDVPLSQSSQSSEEWSIAGVPYVSCVARGVGGGLTGYHANMAIVDDPIKDRQEAQSPARIETLWDWWRDVLRTRILDDGFVLGIWTRWSQDDPAGRLLEAIQKGVSGDRLVMLRLPALAESQEERVAAGKMGLPVDPADPIGRAPGEALWPEMETAAEHEATRRAYPLTFDSLYQGRPRPPGGWLASEANFEILPGLPPAKDVVWCIPTDWAITAEEAAPKRGDPDYTAVGLVGLWTPEGNKEDARLVIAGMEREQADPRGAKTLVARAAQKWAAILGQKPPIRAGQANVDRLYLADLRGWADLVGFSIVALDAGQHKGDKVVRATPWLEMAHAGRAYVVAGPWNNDFFEEVANFPHGKNDDQVDAISVGAAWLGLAGKRDRKVKMIKLQGFGR